jgi:hypothetical protein
VQQEQLHPQYQQRYQQQPGIDRQLSQTLSGYSVGYSVGSEQAGVQLLPEQLLPMGDSALMYSPIGSGGGGVPTVLEHSGIGAAAPQRQMPGQPSAAASAAAASAAAGMASQSAFAAAAARGLMHLELGQRRRRVRVCRRAAGRLHWCLMWLVRFA